MEEKKNIIKEGLYTFGVISGVKLKKFDGVIRKTVHVYPVLQNNDDPRKDKQMIEFQIAEKGQIKVVER